MKIDITTGDVITPSEVDYLYPKMFGEETIKIKAYPIETVLAEKYETILRRNIASTRARDFYDVYILFKTKKNIINFDVFRTAVIKTSIKRDSLDVMIDWQSILMDIQNENALRVLWENYLNENKYISEINFDEIVKCLVEVSKELKIDKQ